MLESAKSKSVRSLQTILEFSAERTLNPLSWTHRFKTHALGSDHIRLLLHQETCVCSRATFSHRQAGKRKREKPTIKRSDTKETQGKKKEAEHWRMDGWSKQRCRGKWKWVQIETRRDRKREREWRDPVGKSSCWYQHFESDWPYAALFMFKKHWF